MIFQNHGQVPVRVVWVKISPLTPLKRGTRSYFIEANKQCTNKYHKSKLFNFWKTVSAHNFCPSRKYLSSDTIPLKENIFNGMFYTLSQLSLFLLISLTIEGLYCKRPMQCLASSEKLTPHPLTARWVCTPPPLVRGEDTLDGWRGGGGQ